jgi:hypothetical protein
VVVATKDPGVLTVWAQVPDGEALGPVRDVMFTTIANVAKEPITEAEVARVRAQRGEELRRDHQRSAGVRHRHLRVDRARRLAPSSSSRATSTDGESADVSASRSTTSSGSNVTVGEYIPDAKPDRAPAPGDPSTSPR